MNSAVARERQPGMATGYVLLSGFVWGCIVTTAETLSQPPLELSLSDYFTFYSRILLHYAVAGIFLAWIASRIDNFDRRFPIWGLVVAMIATATALALLIDQLSLTYVPFWRNDAMSPMIAPLSDVAAHMAWIFTVYGGLYVLTFLFLRHEALTRERLRKTELARISADARMERALTENRSQVIAPDLLVHALMELAQRYNENHIRADRLLDRLVKVLRLASSPPGDSATGTHSRRKPSIATSLGQLQAELEHSLQDRIRENLWITAEEHDHECIGNR